MFLIFSRVSQGLSQELSQDLFQASAAFPEPSQGLFFTAASTSTPQEKPTVPHQKFSQMTVASSTQEFFSCPNTPEVQGSNPLQLSSIPEEEVEKLTRLESNPSPEKEEDMDVDRVTVDR